MNKIKLMLTAVVVLSTVGGVLAFKATRQVDICTAPLKANGLCSDATGVQMCVDEVVGTTTASGSNNLFRCTAAPNPDCDIECPTKVRTTVD